MQQLMAGIFATSIPVVRCTDTTIIVSSTSVLRKVILYPLSDTASQQFALIDHLRPKLPITTRDIVVPCYVQRDDVVLVKGTDSQYWPAHVKNANFENRSADVQFLVSAGGRTGRYVPESRYRRTIHSIHWNSVKEILRGTWDGRSFLPDSSCPLS